MNGSFRSSRGYTWRRLLIPLAFGLVGALAWAAPVAAQDTLKIIVTKH